jgi:hypothetical protein
MLGRNWEEGGDQRGGRRHNWYEIHVCENTTVNPILQLIYMSDFNSYQRVLVVWGFHRDISTHTYNVPWLGSHPQSFSLIPTHT